MSQYLSLRCVVIFRGLVFFDSRCFNSRFLNFRIFFTIFFFVFSVFFIVIFFFFVDEEQEEQDFLERLYEYDFSEVGVYSKVLLVLRVGAGFRGLSFLIRTFIQMRVGRFRVIFGYYRFGQERIVFSSVGRFGFLRRFLC